MPFGPVSTIGRLAFWQTAPTAISWTSSPAAALSAVWFAPQRTSVRFGVAPPTGAVWMSPFGRRRLAETVGARVDHDRALQARAGGDDLLVGAGGGCGEDSEKKERHGGDGTAHGRLLSSVRQA